MMQGFYRDGHPRVYLMLPGVGGSVRVEFIVDTGFDGDLVLPSSIIHRLDAASAGVRNRMLADGSVGRCPRYELLIEWDGEERAVEVLIVDGKPLLGTNLLTEQLLTIEVTENGEVTAEPL